MGSLRDRCRTCRFLALPEGNTSSGYCWQCDMPVILRRYGNFPEEEDPKCDEITGEESAWEPLDILAFYFRKAVEHEQG